MVFKFNSLLPFHISTHTHHTHIPSTIIFPAFLSYSLWPLVNSYHFPNNPPSLRMLSRFQPVSVSKPAREWNGSKAPLSMLAESVNITKMIAAAAFLPTTVCLLLSRQE